MTKRTTVLDVPTPPSPSPAASLPAQPTVLPPLSLLAAAQACKSHTTSLLRVRGTYADACVSSSDLSCICMDTTFLNSATPCLTACGAADIQAGLAFQEQECLQVDSESCFQMSGHADVTLIPLNPKSLFSRHFEPYISYISYISCCVHRHGVH